MTYILAPQHVVIFQVTLVIQFLNSFLHSLVPEVGFHTLDVILVNNSIKVLKELNE